MACLSLIGCGYHAVDKPSVENPVTPPQGWHAATKGQDEQLNTSAVAGWSVAGAAAIGAGIAWWVVGAKRRRAPTISLRPTGIDLRLRF